MDFGSALHALKAGDQVARSGWNGKGMWLMLQVGSEITASQARGGAALGRAEEGAETITILPHIDMRAADGSIVVGWLASQTDMLADDWLVLPRPETLKGAGEAIHPEDGRPLDNPNSIKPYLNTPKPI